jgi:hypothetical protein
MPEMGYEPLSTNDKSVLTEGWHPAYLLAITDEVTPQGWKMAEQSPRMWRWHFAVWEVPTLIDRQAPEHQTAPSSQKFTPKGKQRASKAYAWTVALLQRQVQPGERVNLDPLMPLPCRVKVERNNDYANIVDLEAWPEGTQYLTEAVKQGLHNVLHGTASPSMPSPSPSQQTVTPAPTQVPAQPQPGMQSWGNPAPTPQPATTGTPRW